MINFIQKKGLKKMIESFDSVSSPLKIGNKAYNLSLLNKEKIETPPWICLTTDYFSLKIEPIKTSIEKELSYLLHQNLSQENVSLISKKNKKLNFKFRFKFNKFFK